jgi:hypothetical protein
VPSLDGLVNLVLVCLEDGVHLTAVLGVEHLATQDGLHDGTKDVCRQQAAAKQQQRRKPQDNEMLAGIVQV